jgi:RecA/RadA recombinase
MGLQARLMSQALRKMSANAARAGCTLIFLNQIRHKVSVVLYLIVVVSVEHQFCASSFPTWWDCLTSQMLNKYFDFSTDYRRAGMTVDLVNQIWQLDSFYEFICAGGCNVWEP